MILGVENLWFCAFLWAPKPYFLTWCQDLAACKMLCFIQERSNTLQPSEKLLLIIPSQVGPSAITNIGYCYHIKMMTFYFNCSFFEEIFFFLVLHFYRQCSGPATLVVILFDFFFLPSLLSLSLPTVLENYVCLLKSLKFWIFNWNWKKAVSNMVLKQKEND